MTPQHAPAARRLGRHSWRRPVLVLVAVLPLLTARAATAKGDLFDEILKRSQAIDATLKTIHASFTETTISPLLAKPLVAEGTLSAVRPSDVELVYTKPERKTIAIKGNLLTVDWPDRKIHQERDIAEAQARINHYFVTRKPETLRSHFDITATEDTERAGTYRLDMVPKRKQIHEGLDRLQLWLRKDTLMLDAMRMIFPGGNEKMMEFRDVEINKGG